MYYQFRHNMYQMFIFEVNRNVESPADRAGHEPQAGQDTFLAPTGGIQPDLRLTLIGERIQGHAGFVDTHRLGCTGQQYIDAQGVFRSQLHMQNLVTAAGSPGRSEFETGLGIQPPGFFGVLLDTVTLFIHQRQCRERSCQALIRSEEHTSELQSR